MKTIPATIILEVNPIDNTGQIMLKRTISEDFTVKFEGINKTITASVDTPKEVCVHLIIRKELSNTSKFEDNEGVFGNKEMYRYVRKITSKKKKIAEIFGIPIDTQSIAGYMHVILKIFVESSAELPLRNKKAYRKVGKKLYEDEIEHRGELMINDESYDTEKVKYTKQIK